MFGIHPVASPYLLLIQSHLLQILRYILTILRSVVHASFENFVMLSNLSFLSLHPGFHHTDQINFIIYIGTSTLFRGAIVMAYTLCYALCDSSWHWL